MNKTALWAISFLVTAFFVVFQRATGPTYPAKGSLVTPGGAEISYRLPRSCTIGANDCAVTIKTDRPVELEVQWKRFRTADAPASVFFTAAGGALPAFAPDQPEAGKLEYSVYALEAGSRIAVGPAGVITRFKGAVPAAALIPHILLMFAFMLFSVRIALSVVTGQPVLSHSVYLNLLFLAAGGFLFGPIVQRCAFGVYWSGIPFGRDLTDNKTLLPLFFWAGAALSVLRRGPGSRKWIIAAFAATAAAYFIPHSLLGSEFDYSALDRK